jgi:hypothetical protein
MSMFASGKPLSQKQIVEKVQKTLKDHKEGKFQEALDGYEKVIPLISSQATLLSLHGNAGALYMSTGNYESAKVHFKKAVELDSQNPQAHFNLAVLLTSKLNQHGKAIKHCGLAMKLDSENHKYYHLMGNILQNLGKDTESEKYFQISERLAGGSTNDPKETGATTASDKEKEDPLIRNKLVKGFPFSLTDPNQRITLDNQVYPIHIESVHPLIITVDNFLTSEECDYIIANSQNKLEKSFLMGNSVKQVTSDEDKEEHNVEKQSSLTGEITNPQTNDNKEDDEETTDQLYRSSFNTWLPLDSRLIAFQQKISQLLNLPMGYIQSNSEDLQVVKYDLHGQFKLHQDSSAFHSRLMTVLVYLNEMKEEEKAGTVGGETWFPFAVPFSGSSSSSQELEGKEAEEATRPSSTEKAILLGLNQYDDFLQQWKTNPLIQDHSNLPGLKVTPKKGKITIFFNYRLEDDQLDPRSVHAGLPLRPRKKRDILSESLIEEDKSSQEKWIANYWIKFNREEIRKIEK